MTDTNPEAAPEHDPIDDSVALADHPLTAVRLAKLEALRAQGVDPYPAGFRRTAMAEELAGRYAGLEPGTETDDEVTVAGRILNVRSFGKLRFAVLADASGTIQLFVHAAVLDEEQLALFDQIDHGDWVGATGAVMTPKKGELSVKVVALTLLSKSLRPLPDKYHGLKDTETRYRQRYLDLIVNTRSREIAVARAKVVAELRHQFTKRGFIEVETPVLQQEAGGALARPFVTHHNALSTDMFLRIATELHLKRLVVGGLEKVFELGRIFRNEGIDSTHNPEFTTLEAYQAFADYSEIMELVENVVAEVAVAVTGGTVIEYQGRAVDFTPPFRRARLLDLVSEAVGEPVGFDRSRDDLVGLLERHGGHAEEAWGIGKVITELFEAAVEPHLWEPVFVLDYPKETSPLARVHRQDPNLTERFELFAGGLEFCNAFTELSDPLDQRARFEQQAAAKQQGDAEAHPIDEDYVKALEYGMPPTGGLGFGVDRLVMLLTDSSTIREVVLFPHLRPES